MPDPINPDSRQGAVPLADALVQWSDPALVTAVRAQEAKVPPADLERLERYPIQSMQTHRRLPNRLRPLAFDGAVEELDRAWETLFAAFRLKLERGKTLLEGFPTPHFGEPAARRSRKGDGQVGT
ncbi:hypothetical protein [Falsiroseomonas sp. HW251]|uniref:hypothetical protein n=1 Tax=Falsiroseomonas sp. HW251 TaxID=3390998 RepID=UPI003D319E96